jgi:hypothetical protein
MSDPLDDLYMYGIDDFSETEIRDAVNFTPYKLFFFFPSCVEGLSELRPEFSTVHFLIYVPWIHVQSIYFSVWN